ncbi:MAG: Clp protease N-terminal domain-containing protein [Promethearchaeota archaeon]
MMKFDKFTIKVQEALMAARSLAQERDHQKIEPVHLLIALIDQQDGITTPLLQKLGINIKNLLSDLYNEMARIPKVTGSGAADVVLSRESSTLFDAAWKEADILRDQFLSTEHLLIAMSSKDSLSIFPIIKKNGINKDSILQALKTIRGHQAVVDQDPEGKYQAIEKYSRNLTDLARIGKLDPVKFLNRIDEIVIFDFLNENQLIDIVDIQIKNLNKILAWHKIQIILTEKAKKYLSKHGFDADYGARPLKRTIQNYIQNPLSLKILEGDFIEDDIIRVDVNKTESLKFEKIGKIEGD